MDITFLFDLNPNIPERRPKIIRKTIKKWNKAGGWKPGPESKVRIELINT